MQGATDAAGRRGVALARAAAIEGPGSSDWLRLEIIMDPHTHRYLGARHVVTRDHFIPDTPTGSKGTRFRKGQVLVSRAQLALAVVDALSAARPDHHLRLLACGRRRRPRPGRRAAPSSSQLD